MATTISIGGGDGAEMLLPPQLLFPRSTGRVGEGFLRTAAEPGLLGGELRFSPFDLHFARFQGAKAAHVTAVGR